MAVAVPSLSTAFSAAIIVSASTSETWYVTVTPGPSSFGTTSTTSTFSAGTSNRSDTAASTASVNSSLDACATVTPAMSWSASIKVLSITCTVCSSAWAGSAWMSERPGKSFTASVTWFVHIPLEDKEGGSGRGARDTGTTGRSKQYRARRV